MVYDQLYESMDSKINNMSAIVQTFYHGTNIAKDDDIVGEWATEKCAASLHNMHFASMYHHSGPPPQRNVQHP